MAFVLQDVINQLEESHSLEPLKKLKKENLVNNSPLWNNSSCWCNKNIFDLIEDYCFENNINGEIEEKRKIRI